MNYNIEKLSEAVKAKEMENKNTELLEQAKKLGIDLEQFKEDAQKEEVKKHPVNQSDSQSKEEEEKLSSDSNQSGNNEATAEAIATAVANAMKEVINNKEDNTKSEDTGAYL